MRVISSISILIFCTVQSISCHDAPVVSVEQGQLAGTEVNAIIGDTKYFSFKGIPYAQPPVGSLRFKAPQKPSSWEGVRNASAHGDVCPQFNPISGEYTPGNEDCLFLNVYTPDLKPKTPLPVMFFIHGGAYMFGSGDSSLYGPDFLVSNGVITVTINYRLGHFGFLCLGNKDVPGNAGLKDQLAALQWVNKNIAAFGGDPKQVTIFGTTAGSSSVTFHLVSPRSKGLFNRAIAMSGTTSCDWSLSFEPVRRAFSLGRSLGYTGTSADELLTYLQKAEIKDIVMAAPTVISAEKIIDILFKMEPFSPVIEIDFGDAFITIDAYKLLKSGNVNKADVMFGYNSKEALLLIDFYNATYIQLFGDYPELFAPVEFLFGTAPKTYLQAADKVKQFYFGDKPVTVDNIAQFVDYASNASVAYDVQRFFSKWPAVGKSYFYKFSGRTSRNLYGPQGEKYGVDGCSHFDEVAYLFNPEAFNMPLVKGTEEYKIVMYMTTAVTNFAKYGNPSPNGSLGITWPEYDKENKAYVDIGSELIVGNAPDAKDMEFWQSLFEFFGLEF